MRTTRRYFLARLSGGLLAVFGLLLLAGCFTLSVEPFYLTKDLVWQEDLVGVWGDPEDSDSETWQFTAAGDDAYRLVVRQHDSLRINPDEDGLFEAHLFQVAGRLYLDLFPEEPERGSDFYKGHIVPAHTVWLAELQGDELSLRVFEGNRLEEAVAAGELAMSYLKRDGTQVLTGESAALREMLRQGGEALFGEAEIVQKIQ